MTKLYKLKIAPDHRYEWLPIRLKNGQKKMVGKIKAVILGSDKLAEGEEFTIMRYKQEGRMIVVETEAKKRKPRKKKKEEKVVPPPVEAVPPPVEIEAIEPDKLQVKKVKVAPEV